MEYPDEGRFLKILLEVAERNRLLGASEENRVSSGVCHSGRIYEYAIVYSKGKGCDGKTLEVA